jgi:hypothetical protein
MTKSNDQSKTEGVAAVGPKELLDGCPVCGLPVTPHVTKDCCIEALKEALDKATRRFDERYGFECDVCHVLKPLRDLKYVERKMICIACLHPYDGAMPRRP